MEYPRRAAQFQENSQHGRESATRDYSKSPPPLVLVLCSEHPDFPEPVAQLRPLPISIFIPSTFLNAPSQRAFEF
ncbi:uncharacterized protein N7529_010962 [Penicillium soppii]|uniref:uncharacterized protein n=1 Tax=Penicillium soppii TaxID=69789 RepID=UPI0025496006|nr:uncharacterized protein N7529_010962 [Penicillium soppii]KAJ5851577.1 hypothetical protein N7529_010962 [Penicillium soppii]